MFNADSFVKIRIFQKSAKSFLSLPALGINQISSLSLKLIIRINISLRFAARLKARDKAKEMAAQNHAHLGGGNFSEYQNYPGPIYRSYDSK